MNKRYIDFVPAKRKAAGNGGRPGVASGTSGGRPGVAGASGVSGASGRRPGAMVSKKTAPKVVEKAWSDELEYDDEIPLSQMFVEKAPLVGVSTGLYYSNKDRTEDYQQKFVKTEVKKRPLGVQKSGFGIKKRLLGAQKPNVATVKAAEPKKAAKMAGGNAVSRSTAARSGATSGAAPRANSGAAPRATSGAASKAVPRVAGVAPRTTGVAPKTSVAASKAAASSHKPAAQGMAKLQPTRAKFLNTNKIVKRPLSKNVYAGKLQPTREIVAESSSQVSKKSEKPVVIIAKPEKDSKAGLVVAIIITIILGAAAGTVAFLLLPK